MFLSAIVQELLFLFLPLWYLLCTIKVFICITIFVSCLIYANFCYTSFPLVYLESRNLITVWGTFLLLFLLLIPNTLLEKENLLDDNNFLKFIELCFMIQSDCFSQVPHDFFKYAFSEVKVFRILHMFITLYSLCLPIRSSQLNVLCKSFRLLRVLDN